MLACPPQLMTDFVLPLKCVCSCFGTGAGKGQKLQKNIITQLLHLECHRVRRRPVHCARARPQVSATRSGRGRKAIHCCVCQQSEQLYSRTLNSKLSAEPENASSEDNTDQQKTFPDASMPRLADSNEFSRHLQNQVCYSKHFFPHLKNTSQIAKQQKQIGKSAK